MYIHCIHAIVCMQGVAGWRPLWNYTSQQQSSQSAPWKQALLSLPAGVIQVASSYYRPLTHGKRSSSLCLVMRVADFGTSWRAQYTVAGISNYDMQSVLWYCITVTYVLLLSTENR